MEGCLDPRVRNPQPYREHQTPAQQLHRSPALDPRQAAGWCYTGKRAHWRQRLTFRSLPQAEGPQRAEDAAGRAHNSHLSAPRAVEQPEPGAFSSVHSSQTRGQRGVVSMLENAVLFFWQRLSHRERICKCSAWVPGVKWKQTSGHILQLDPSLPGAGLRQGKIKRKRSNPSTERREHRAPRRTIRAQTELLFS